MSNIKLDLKNTNIDMEEILDYKSQVKEIDRILRQNPNNPYDFIGWLELPSNYDKEEFERIKQAGARIRR